MTCLTYCVDQELRKAIEYLKEQVGILKEQQEKDKRILLDNRQRIGLAAKADPPTQESSYAISTHQINVDGVLPLSPIPCPISYAGAFVSSATSVVNSLVRVVCQCFRG